MQNYCKTSHSVYDLKYHLAWTTQNRKAVLHGKVAERVLKLIREICKANDVYILKDQVSKDHVHIFVPAPPHVQLVS